MCKVKYTVFCLSEHSPYRLQHRLNKMVEVEGLELVGIYKDFFIFKAIEESLLSESHEVPTPSSD